MLDRTKAEALRAMFIDIVQDIRKAKGDADMSNFYVSLEADGRTMSGEAKLTFRVGDNSYSQVVEASELIPAFDEHMRRKGFNARHAALALPSPGLPFETDLANEAPY